MKTFVVTLLLALFVFAPARPAWASAGGAPPVASSVGKLAKPRGALQNAWRGAKWETRFKIKSAAIGVASTALGLYLYSKGDTAGAHAVKLAGDTLAVGGATMIGVPIGLTLGDAAYRIGNRFGKWLTK